ncbi:MAG: hypothetical protein WC461_01665 [Candidatus Paceibacterota bacterium]
MEKELAFINAISEANKYIANNKEELPNILSKNTRLAKDLASKVALPLFKDNINKNDIQPVIDASYKYGFIKNKFDAAEIVVNNLKLK